MAKKDSPRSKRQRDEVGVTKDVHRANEKIIKRLKTIPSVTSQLRKDCIVSVERRRVPFTI